MKKYIPNNQKRNIDIVCVFIVMLLVFSYIMFVIKENSDLCAHVRIAQNMLTAHKLFSNNFLMYFLINLLTLFTGYELWMQTVLVILISISNTIKYWLVRDAFKEWTTETTAKLSSAALLFVYVIPLMYFLKPFGIFMSANNMYLGYYVPNVWHNSTILCMMPFSIACYLLSAKQFNEYSDKRNWQITLLLTISTLIKPSFFFIYLIAYPIVMLKSYGAGKELFKSLLPLLCGGICLLYEYITIYYGGGDDGSGVVINIMPLFNVEFWKSHALYLLVSFILPLSFLCLYSKLIYKDNEFWFVLIMLICSLGLMWCCQETGPRAAHGNFNWSAIAATWFVYYYILKTILQHCEWHSLQNGGGYSYTAVLALFALHVVMGFVYLGKFLITHNFG